MSKLKTIIDLVEKRNLEGFSKAVGERLCYSKATKVLPDKLYLKLIYRLLMGKKLKLDNPQTFNEKLQWLKLNNRNLKYHQMVDKQEVKQYVAGIIGDKYIIPTIGIWDRFENIDFESLPNQFVLKCTHDSGSVVICRDKDTFDYKKAKIRITRGLKSDLFWFGREWPYKNLTRKVIAEQFMKSGAGSLTDFKVHCFNGEPKLILVCKDRFTQTGLTEDFFDSQWKHLDIKRSTHLNTNDKISKPEELQEMLALAKKLSENIPFLRVDFYIVEHKIYFSELTFFPASGFERFVPEQWDKLLGSWIDLTKFGKANN